MLSPVYEFARKTPFEIRVDEIIEEMSYEFSEDEIAYIKEKMLSLATFLNTGDDKI
jgi:hypothetical protein